MKLIDIQETEKTPKIFLDDEKHIFEMSGRSHPENIRDFYFPVIKVMEKYLKKISAENQFRLNFKMGYFNSASAKFIADILLLVDNYIKKNYNIKIYWFYREDDEDMLEAGEEFSELLDVKFNYIMVHV